MYAAPAGGSLPLRGRWQGEALTDEGKKPLPFNEARFYSIGVPSTPGPAGPPSPSRRGQEMLSFGGVENEQETIMRLAAQYV